MLCEAGVLLELAPEPPTLLNFFPALLGAAPNEGRRRYTMPMRMPEEPPEVVTNRWPRDAPHGRAQLGVRFDFFGLPLPPGTILYERCEFEVRAAASNTTGITQLADLNLFGVDGLNLPAVADFSSVGNDTCNSPMFETAERALDGTAAMLAVHARHAQHAVAQHSGESAHHLL